jgi:hypothetical protein
MRLSVPFPRLAPMILLAALGVVFLAVAAGRLGGGGDGADVEQVIQGAFAGDSFKSGRFDANVNASLQASGRQQNAEVQMSGAFQSERGESAPQLDMDMTIKGAGTPLQLGVVSTGDEAFIEAQGAAYRVPADRFRSSFASGVERRGSTPLAALGVDPGDWLVNATDEGSADVGGVETTHVSAGVDTSKMIDDVFALAQKTGDSRLSGVSSAQKDQLEKAVQSAKVDLYAAKSDGTLRKLAAQVSLDTPQGSGNVSFEMEVTDVNKPQEISAPDNALPLSALDQNVSANLLSGLQAGAAGSRSSGTSEDSSRSAGERGGSRDSGSSGSSAGSSAGAGTDPGTASYPEPARAYLRCVERARSSADLQKCAPLLD